MWPPRDADALREWLEGLMVLRARVEIARRQIERMKDARQLRAVRYKADTIQTNAVSDPTYRSAETVLLKLPDKQRRIARHELQLVEYEAARIALPEDERVLIVARYERGLSDARVMDDLHLARSTYYRLRQRALERLLDALRAAI